MPFLLALGPDLGSAGRASDDRFQIWLHDSAMGDLVVVVASLLRG